MTIRTLRGALLAATLRDIVGWNVLSYASGNITLGSALLFTPVVRANILAKCCSASSCLFLIGESSNAGYGLMRVEVSFTAAPRAASAD